MRKICFGKFNSFFQLPWHWWQCETCKNVTCISYTFYRYNCIHTMCTVRERHFLCKSAFKMPTSNRIHRMMRIINVLLHHYEQYSKWKKTLMACSYFSRKPIYVCMWSNEIVRSVSKIHKYSYYILKVVYV